MGIITISRTHGSGGTMFARELAKRLDYLFINRTYINNDCRESDYHICMFGDEDDISPRLRKNVQDLMTDANFHKVSMIANILDHALKNNAVFLGMGAGIVLSGISNTINLRVVRLLEERVKAIAQVKNIPYDDSFDLIEKMDGGKEDYIARYFDADVNDPALYHLMINSSHISLDDAVDIVANYLYKHFTPSHTKEAETALKNRLLEKRAEILLFRLGMMHSYGNVTFHASGDGILSIAGVLRNEAEKDLLLQTLGNNKDIKEIKANVHTGVL